MKTNVLVFPAGEINSIELHDALSHNVNIDVYGASSVDRHGSYVFKYYKSNLPLISDESFIDDFNRLIAEWNIDFVFPTHDTVALFMADNQNLIKAKVIVAERKTALICRDKKQTYDLFSDCDFCPKVYSDFKYFPVFIKPREGQGSKGTCLIKSVDEIPNDLKIEDYVISEYLPGEELTIDCLTDKEGNLCVCLPRIRNRLLAGVSVAGETIVASDEIIAIAETINKRLKFLGLWFFQLKKDSEGRYKLLEVSTRCAGTMCLSRARGVNLPLLSVYAAMGRKISVFENPYSVIMDRTLISRYKIDYEYDAVYVDYDDTIIEGDTVCLPVIQFLYQCRNQKKKIYLLTRHESDHEDSLEENFEKHAISMTLFDDVIKLSFEQNKADSIQESKSIFIDNSYTERKMVHDRCRIPVFDVEGIEVLLDWRN